MYTNKDEKYIKRPLDDTTTISINVPNEISDVKSPPSRNLSMIKWVLIVSLGCCALMYSASSSPIVSSSTSEPEKELNHANAAAPETADKLVATSPDSGRQSAETAAVQPAPVSESVPVAQPSAPAAVAPDASTDEDDDDDDDDDDVVDLDLTGDDDDDDDDEEEDDDDDDDDDDDEEEEDVPQPASANAANGAADPTAAASGSNSGTTATAAPAASSGSDDDDDDDEDEDDDYFDRFFEDILGG